MIVSVIGAARPASFNGDFYIAMDTVFPVLLLAVGLVGTLVTTVVEREAPAILEEDTPALKKKKAKLLKLKPGDLVLRNMRIANRFSNLFLLAGLIGMILSTAALLWRFREPWMEYFVFACFVVTALLIALAIVSSLGKAMDDAFFKGLDRIYNRKPSDPSSSNGDGRGS
jgi:hypothetical protein